MSEPTPNPAQDELITSTDGIYKVDAGAGTGKTFAVTRRYGTIVGQDGIDPSDVLLVTFTENAATEMKERIVGHAPYKMRELADAPIQTFHSLAHDLLDEHGAAAPTLIGIDGYISGSTTIVDNELIEAQLFADFFDRFSASHPEYESFLGVVDDPTALLSEIKKLAAKGVFPTADGWYRSGEAALDGDFEAFESLFAEQNAPRNSGNKQSKLRAGLTEYGDGGLHTPDAPPKHEIRGTGKQIPAEIAELVFEEDRRELKSFVHDLYFEYLEFAVERNYLNFAFLQLFAFVLLCENHALRASIAYEYVMIDEFQDTSEIQFKLALLLSSGANFCVVGDWKQSIYSFQYAAVENLTAFADRIKQFRSDLNDSHRRVDISDADIAALETISLTKNYRSTQSILDFSSHAFSTPATSSESHSPQSVESLRADKAADDSRIEAFQHAEEHDALLTKIEALVGNPDYAIQTADGSRVPTYDDIAVFTRTRSFGRELLERAEAASVPMAYEGGVELFRSALAKLLLAWLRIVEYDVDRGWAPILERAGYAMGDIEAIFFC